MDADRFAAFAGQGEPKDDWNKPMFSSDASTFHAPYQVAEGVYTETNVSATYICRRIALLLGKFGMNLDDMAVYLATHE